MNERRFEFGETRKATISVAHPGMLIAIDEFEEGHLLLFTVKSRRECEFAEGDAGTLTFTAGGPKGGYWKFTKDGASE